jgi:hypothetical protein
MSRSKPGTGTREEVAIRAWRELNSESVGARELAAIQEAIHEALGEGAVDSPASIARTLAAAGARLRHPEVLECDTRWREERLSGFVTRDELSFASVPEAEESLARLEQLRQEFAGAGDDQKLRRLRQFGLQLRSEFAIVASAQAGSDRILAKELDQWLAVWLQTPDLFPDWLSLRRRSPGFIKALGPDG